MVRDLQRYYNYSEVFQSLLITKDNKTLKDYKSIHSHVGCSSLGFSNHLLTIAFFSPLKRERTETAVMKLLTLKYKEQCCTVKC